MEPLNRMATELVDEAIDFADELGIGVYHLENDAAVLDFGIDHEGGVEAGLLLTEIRTGGLATVQTRVDEVDGAPLAHVEVSTDHPELALLDAGLAGWEPDGIDGVGSGPARRLAAGEEEFDFAVLVVESTELPDAEMAAEVASEAGVPTSGVFLPTAPVGSLAGSVMTAAAAAEVAVFRLDRLGYDPGAVLSATASAPVAPIAGDETTARARTNDAIAYGSQVHLVVDDPDVPAEELPFEATDHAGRTFADLFEDHDLHDLEDAFAPASVTVDVRGGPTHVVGGIDGGRLAELLGL